MKVNFFGRFEDSTKKLIIECPLKYKLPNVNVILNMGVAYCVKKSKECGCGKIDERGIGICYGDLREKVKRCLDL
jgi:hypothetical protein